MLKRAKRFIGTLLAISGLIASTPLPIFAASGEVEYTFNDTLKSKDNSSTATVNGSSNFTNGVDGKAIKLNNANIDLGKISFTENGDFTVVMAARLQRTMEHEKVLLANKNWDTYNNQGICLASFSEGVGVDFAASDKKTTRVAYEGGFSHISDTRWNQFTIVVHRNTYMKFYVNGKLVTATDISAKKGMSIGNQNWRIGSDINGKYTISGLEVDNIKFVNAAWQASAVETEYNNWGSKLRSQLLSQAGSMSGSSLLNKAISKANSMTDMFMANKMLYSAMETAQQGDSRIPNLSFSVFADYHIYHEEGPLGIYDEMADSLYLSNRGMDSIVHLGDLTRDGFTELRVTERNYVNDLTNYFKQYVNNQIIFGNHETGIIEGSKDDTALFNKNAVPWYKQLTGKSTLWYEETISGYQFINLNSEAPAKSYHMVFSDTQLNWLKSVLSKNTDKNKPIFINIHEPFINTSEWNKNAYGMGPTSDKKLREILKNYPNAVIFTGHMHNDRETVGIHQQDFGTLVDCPSTRMNDGIGWIVNVYGNTVELKLRDYKNDQWLRDYDITFTTPATDVYDTSKDLTSSLTYSKDKAKLTDTSGTTGTDVVVGSALTMTLDNPATVEGMKLQPTITSDYQVFTGIPSGIKVETSTNGTTWKTVLNTRIPKNCAYHYYKFNTIESNVKQVRVYFTGAYVGSSVNIAEMTLVGTKGTSSGSTATGEEGYKKVIKATQPGSNIDDCASRVISKAISAGAGYVSGGKSYRVATGSNTEVGFDSSGFVTWVLQATFSGAVPCSDSDIFYYEGKKVSNPATFIDACGWRHISYMDLAAWNSWLNSENVFYKEYSTTNTNPADFDSFSPGSIIMFYNNSDKPIGMALKGDNGTVTGAFNGFLGRENLTKFIDAYGKGCTKYKVYAYEYTSNSTSSSSAYEQPIIKSYTVSSTSPATYNLSVDISQLRRFKNSSTSSTGAITNLPGSKLNIYLTDNGITKLVDTATSQRNGYYKFDSNNSVKKDVAVDIPIPSVTVKYIENASKIDPKVKENYTSMGYLTTRLDAINEATSQMYANLTKEKNKVSSTQYEIMWKETKVPSGASDKVGLEGRELVSGSNLKFKYTVIGNSNPATDISTPQSSLPKLTQFASTYYHDKGLLSAQCTDALSISGAEYEWHFGIDSSFRTNLYVTEVTARYLAMNTPIAYQYARVRVKVKQGTGYVYGPWSDTYKIKQSGKASSSTPT